MESSNPHVESLKCVFFKLEPHGFLWNMFLFFAKQKKQLFVLGHPIFETRSSEQKKDG